MGLHAIGKQMNILMWKNKNIDSSALNHISIENADKNTERRQKQITDTPCLKL